jgi:hypothetical protein
MPLPFSLRAYVLATAILGLAACGSQADTNYRGEPLATLSGTVESQSGSAASGPMDAALVWAQVEFSPNAQLIQSINWVGESAPVSGQFPASFTLDVYLPPPSSVIIACPSSSGHVAVANIVAVPAGVNINSSNLVQSVVGEAEQSLLLYLDSDQPAGWTCLPDWGFTFAPTKGFHLVNMVPNSIQPRAYGSCYPAFVEAPGGLQTPVTITLYGNSSPANFSGSGSGCSSVGGIDCLSLCQTKAASCNAPSSQAMTVCEALCGRSPTPSQLSCIQSSDCASLENAFDTTGTLCGIGGSIQLDAGLPESSVPTSNDAGGP